MESTNPVEFLPSPLELPLTADRTDFCRRVYAYLEVWPPRYGEHETAHVAYLEALGYLVRSYPEARWTDIWAERVAQLPTTGKHPSDATHTELYLATAAIYGWARDRVQKRRENMGLAAWLESAAAGLAAYKADPPVLPVGSPDENRLLNTVSGRSAQVPA